ncbi:MAG: GNAT family N-acetyltransferase [Chloroflexales bacterium]|nr:GNAT family N-acetyltransferase [Chloroflexales bacterium]
MNYRFATESDIDLLAKWNHQLISDEGHRNAMSIRELRERMQRWLTEDEYTAVIFSLDAEPVAYALYSARNREVYLRQLFVARSRRRQGIGKQVIRILREQLWLHQQRLTVEVLAANKPAVAFWRAAGYVDYTLTLEMMLEGIE